MIRRRNLLLIALLFFTLFILTTNYLLIILPSSENEVRKEITTEEKIYQELEKLPIQYKQRPLIEEKTTDIFLENIRKTDKKLESLNLEQLWREANSWVSKTQLLNLSSPSLGKVFFALKNAKIIKSDVDTRGTQLKLLLTLEGDQQVVFKPKWYEKERIIEGPVYAGKDRYGSEIIGFYLSVILKRPLTPASLQRDYLIPLLKEITELVYMESVIFVKKEDPVCEDQNSFINGAVIFNIKASLSNYRSPWQRTYKKGKKAHWQEFSDAYCKTVKEKLPKKRVYDLIDTSIFDFLIQNGDRHHYETFDDTVIWLDNGKGLGNPNVHHIDILAPLYQCCILRRETWKALLGLTGGELRKKLESMPDINNFITEDHLKAIEARLLIIFATIEYCKHYKEADHYLL
ncbi:hypothetical protein NQ314_012820 [Rhamnusium bicolor]|uniref:FAM20 C-terminal domain-containing protein n=1 Tax=Rhamnusium bicolor TaxID=1586634 RepID=A0AAV8XA92_9CUCU|nr:hypothetical protein NQ314_012820 [Rhamnusium bicolor]